MIAFENVCVRDGNTVLLDGVSLRVASGEKVVIGGPSGSGKSTVLLTLMGGYRPASGRVLFNGEEVTAQTINRVRTTAAYIGQEPVLGAGTVRDGLLLPFTFRANRSRLPASEQIAGVLAALGLPGEILDKNTDLLSGGEKQRIAIARGLLSGKTLFVVDEITSALDEESNRSVLEQFLRPAFTVLAVSHHPRWLAACDTQLRLEAGRITGSHAQQQVDTP